MEKAKEKLTDNISKYYHKNGYPYDCEITYRGLPGDVYLDMVIDLHLFPDEIFCNKVRRFVKKQRPSPYVRMLELRLEEYYRKTERFYYEQKNNEASTVISKDETKTSADNYENFVWDNSGCTLSKEDIVQRKEKSITEKVRDILGNRSQDYGDVKESFFNIAEMWEYYLGRKITPEDVGNMMILLKVCRESSSRKEDNLIDIVGYVKCIKELK